MLGTEVPSVVCGTSEEDRPISFVGLGTRDEGVPDHMDISMCVRGHGAAPVQSGGLGDHIPLRFEGRACIVHPRVEHGNAYVCGRRCFRTSIPCHVNPSVASEGHLGSTYRTDSNGASRLAVDSNGLGPLSLPSLLSDILKVAGGRIP